jgi:hypothetical protein
VIVPLFFLVGVFVVLGLVLDVGLYTSWAYVFQRAFSILMGAFSEFVTCMVIPAICCLSWVSRGRSIPCTIAHTSLLCVRFVLVRIEEERTHAFILSAAFLGSNSAPWHVETFCGCVTMCFYLDGSGYLV